MAERLFLRLMAAFALALLGASACGGDGNGPVLPLDEGNEGPTLRDYDREGSGSQPPGGGGATTDTPGDDGNTPSDPGTPDNGGTGTDPGPGDGGGTAAGVESEPNETMGAADLLSIVPGTEGGIDAALVPGDIDLFRIQVDSPAEIEAYVDDGSGGCTVDSVLRLLGQYGEEIAEDDDGGTAPCSLIESAPLSAAGTYYLEVTGFLDEEAGGYALHVLITVPVCGDARLSAGEECDDGGHATDDGCDASCRYEALDEAEPNDTAAQADAHPYTATASTPAFIRGNLADGDDVDLYAFAMGLGDTFTRIDIMSAGDDCAAEPELDLLGPDGETVLESAYTYYDGSYCASLSEEDYDTGLTNLDEGIHYIAVSSGYGEGGPYLLHVITRQAECGNGIRERGELCDDANEDSEDGCNACALSGAAETESNDDRASADALGTFTEAATTTVAGETAGNDVDYFAVVVGENASIIAWTSDGASSCEFDTLLKLYDAAGTELASDDDDGEVSCSRLDKTDTGATNLAAGTYYLAVSPYSDLSDGGVYLLNVQIGYPECGDGLIEGDEVCDDHNPAGGDGCSEACLPEGTPESEPNNDAGEPDGPFALTPPGDDVFAVGQLATAADVDYIAVTVGAGARLGARLGNGSGGCSIDGGSLSLRTSAGALVRAGVALPTDEGCWQVGGTADPYTPAQALAAGTYLVRVATSDATGGYQLVLWAEYGE